jgi:DHA1 family multidrug resistance protein-like MFS transporter
MAPYLIRESDFTLYFVFSGSFVVVSVVAMAVLVRETLPPELRSRRKAVGKRPDSGFIASARALGRVFAVFLVAILLYRTGYTMMDPFFSIYLREVLALDLSSTSYLFALRAVCTMVFAPVAGWLTDKWGRKPTFMAGMALMVVSLVAYTMMRDPGDIYLVRGLDAVAGVVLMNSIRTLTADLLAPEVRGFGMGLYSTISQESSTLGAIFGGLVIDSMGYNMVFLLAAGASALSLFIVKLWVPEPSVVRMIAPKA